MTSIEYEKIEYATDIIIGNNYDFTKVFECQINHYYDSMKEYIFVDVVGPSYTSTYAAFIKKDPHSEIAPSNFITLQQLKSKLEVN